MPKRLRLPLALALLAALLGLFFRYIWLIAAGSQPGFRGEVMADVKIFYPAAKDKSVSAFLAPPPPLLKNDEKVPLSVLFRNDLDSAVVISSVLASPQDCFTLRPASESLQVGARQSKLEVEELSWNNTQKTIDCGERQSMVLSFQWKAIPAPAKTAATKRKQLVHKKGNAPALPSGSYAIATSQIRLPRTNRITWERFFHILGLLAGAILTPLVIAIATLLYQKSSAERESRRKVWEIIYPDIVKNIQTHYAPILRRLRILLDALDALPTPPVVTNLDPFAEAVLLARAEVVRFATDRGGFLFRSKPAEELCSTIFSALWDKVLDTTNPAILKLVEHGISGKKVVSYLPAAVTASADFITYRNSLLPVLVSQQDRTDLKSLLTLAMTIIQLESDHPFYPEWYDSKSSFNSEPIQNCLIHKQSTSFLVDRITTDVKEQKLTRQYAKQYLKETRAWAKAE